MLLLHEGKRPREIALLLNVSPPVVSKSISNIRLKVYDIENEIEFLKKIGFLRIENNRLEFISNEKDPKIFISGKE